MANLWTPSFKNGQVLIWSHRRRPSRIRMRFKKILCYINTASLKCANDNCRTFFSSFFSPPGPCRGTPCTKTSLQRCLRLLCFPPHRSQLRVTPRGKVTPRVSLLFHPLKSASFTSPHAYPAAGYTSTS